MGNRIASSGSLKKQPSAKGPVEMFTGEVYFDVIYKGEEPSRKRVNTVRFGPCALSALIGGAVS